MSDDRFLNFLTARGSVRVEALREIITTLAHEDGSAQSDKYRAYRLARGIDMLGHGEYHARSKPAALHVAPACLARLPSIDRPRYLLCGARSAGAVGEIREAAAAARIRLSYDSARQQAGEELLPNKITITVDDDGEARRVAELLSIGWSAAPAAWSLACLCQSMSQFEAGLQWRPRSISSSQLKYYDAASLQFNDAASEDEMGLAQVGETPPAFFMIEKDREARVDDLDWARCWCHSRHGVACIQYDARRRLFAVASRVPLPRLLARALCLCSGESPVTLGRQFLHTRRDSLVFSDVPSEIAQKIAEKLEIHLIPHPITHLPRP